MLPLRGAPFAPGQARGRLRRGPKTGRSNIALLEQGDLAALREVPAGILTVDVAPFSHPAIHLLGLGIPVVLLSSEHARGLAEGVLLAMDGATGRICEPGALSLGKAPPAPPPGQPVLTRNAKPVELRASVGAVRGAECARLQGAASIGLVRSEYLLPGDESAPDIRFFEAVIADLCRAAAPLPVTLRLLDLAADKLPPWAPKRAELVGPLGLRGARLYAWEPVRAMLDQQLAAVAGLVSQFPLRLLLPYAVRVDEFAQWRSSIKALVGENVPVGAMLETPAAVLDMAVWLKAADFLAVGCNDLMQCLFGADRDLPELRDGLDPYAPALYRILRQGALAAGRRAGPLQLCGLLPQVQGVLPVLIGLGYRTVSVSPALVPALAEVVSRTDEAQARALAARVLRARSSAEVRSLLGLQPDAPWGLGGPPSV
jgi:phosphoenolpyruvate-protein kinase (PTS system EI component)